MRKSIEAASYVSGLAALAAAVGAGNGFFERPRDPGRPLKRKKLRSYVARKNKQYQLKGIRP